MLILHLYGTLDPDMVDDIPSEPENVSTFENSNQPDYYTDLNDSSFS